VSDVPALAVKGLLAGYGQARVLHGLDFALARGEMVVVIGPQRRRQDNAD
jgi:ABC-type branched-chain amino acid transport systems, ATPase component